MKKLASLFIVFSFSFSAHALQTIVNRPHGPAKGLVVIAPAKKYLMQERLFSELAAKLAAHGFVAVRFNWSSDTLALPEQELQRASRDIHLVTSQAQRFFGFGKNQTILVSKSFSTKALAPVISLARSQVLLTPNCSQQETFAATYLSILTKPETNFRILISAEDPYCDIRQIYETLSEGKQRGLLNITHGDHNFVAGESTTSKYRYQDLAIDDVVQWILGVTR